MGLREFSVARTALCEAIFQIPKEDMTMVAKLRIATAPGLSPEREKLRIVIENRERCRTRLGAMKAAGESMMRDSWDLRRQLEDATKAVEEADQLAVSNQIERGMNRPPIPGQSPSEARQAVNNLEDQVTTMQRARTHLESQGGMVERDLEKAEGDVRDAVAAAAKSDPRIKQLCDKFFAVRKEMIELRRCLMAVAMKGGVPDWAKTWYEDVTAHCLPNSTLGNNGKPRS
jgi:hypothetical protein